MAKSKCLNCDGPFDQTPGKREKKFCKPSCRVSYCQKQNRLKSKITFAKSTESSFDGSLHRALMDEVGKTVPIGDYLPVKSVRKKKPVKKGFKVPTDKHGAGKIVKESVQKKEVKKAPAVSNFLEQRRKQKLG